MSNNISYRGNQKVSSQQNKKIVNLLVIVRNNASEKVHLLHILHCTHPIKMLGKLFPTPPLNDNNLFKSNSLSVGSYGGFDKISRSIFKLSFSEFFVGFTLVKGSQ